VRTVTYWYPSKRYHARHNRRRGFELSIDDDKTIPLATLAEFVTDQNIESVLLEELVESLDAAPVESLLDAAPVEALSVARNAHAHGNGDQRFQRVC